MPTRNGGCRLLAGAAFMLAVLFSSVTRAEEAAPTSEPREKWYGWQTLTVDASVAAVTTAVLVSPIDAGERSQFFLPLLGAYLLGAPIVHFAHQRPIGLASLGVRVATPLFILVLDANAEGSIDETTAIVVYALAIAVPVTLDAAVFAYEPVDSGRAPEASTSTLFVSPLLVPRSGSYGGSPLLGASLTGAF